MDCRRGSLGYAVTDAKRQSGTTSRPHCFSEHPRPNNMQPSKFNGTGALGFFPTVIEHWQVVLKQYSFLEDTVFIASQRNYTLTGRPRVTESACL